MRKTVIYLFLGVVAVFIAVVLFLKSAADRAIKLNEEDPKHSTQNIPKLYLNSFPNIKSWSFKESIESKFREPISEFKINDAQLFIYNMGKFTLPVDKIINEYFIDSHVSFGYAFNVLTENDMLEILYKSESAQKCNGIFLNLYGDDTQKLIKNDTIAYYYSNFKTFSIGYQGSGIQDFFGKVEDQYVGKKIPLEVLFIKKNNNLYVLLMTINKKDTLLQPFELYNTALKK